MKHTIRTRNYTTTKKVVTIEPYTRSRAIKAFCTECLGYEDHPKYCETKLCPLLPYRGKTTLAYVEGEEA